LEVTLRRLQPLASVLLGETVELLTGTLRRVTQRLLLCLCLRERSPYPFGSGGWASRVIDKCLTECPAVCVFGVGELAFELKDAFPPAEDIVWTCAEFSAEQETEAFGHGSATAF
jgi:hypothetical protein